MSMSLVVSRFAFDAAYVTVSFGAGPVFAAVFRVEKDFCYVAALQYPRLPIGPIRYEELLDMLLLIGTVV
jgi:hypothetical protein